MPINTSAPQSLDADFSAIKAKMDADYQNNQSIWNVFWTRANQNVRLEAGDPTIMNSWGNNNASLGSSSYYFNRARPIGLMLSGYQRRNRKSTIVIPLEAGDQRTADQFTKLIMNTYKRENVYEKISEAFHEGSIISGMSLMQLYLDFTKDPVNGDMKYRHLAYNEFMIDPFFREPDLSDATFIRLRTYKTKPEIAAIMPDKDYDAIMSLQGNQQGSTIDGRFQYQAAARGFAMGPKIAYDEYYYRDYREATFLYDTLSGDIREVSDRDDLNIPQILAEYPQLRLQKKYIPTIRLAICIQDKIFYDGPHPLNLDNYNFVPFLGFYNKSMPYMYNRIQSVMTSLISPQILFNRRIILNADFLESVVNTGYMFRQSAVLDPKHLLQTGQGRMIPIKDSATPLVDVVPIPAPNIPPSAFQQLEVYDKELFNVIGLSQENLGKVVEDDSSGYQTALRTAAGLTAQQGLFDRLDLSQNMMGNIFIEIVQKNWTPGKVQRLLGGEQPTPQFYDADFGKYHCAVENGFNTETQKQLEFIQLLELRKHGIAISDARMIDKATIQGKEEIIKELQAASEQQQQAQQMQMQMQQMQMQAQLQASQAKAQADLGLADERRSEIQHNNALAIEKMHEANKNDAAATLDMIKAIKELQTIDIQHLQTLVGLANQLKAAEQATALVEENKVNTPESGTVPGFDRGNNPAAAQAGL